MVKYLYYLLRLLGFRGGDGVRLRFGFFLPTEGSLLIKSSTERRN